jgi:hypothetical protein
MISGGVRGTTPAQFFGTTDGRFVPFRRELRRALCAAALSAESTCTLQLLYEYAETTLSLNEPDTVDAEGRVKVWPTRERLAAELLVDRRTLQRYLTELEDLGLLVRGSGSDLWMTPVQTVIEQLLARPDAQARLKLMYPEKYDRKVLPFDPEVRAVTSGVRARTSKGARVLALAEYGTRQQTLLAEDSTPVFARASVNYLADEAPWAADWSDDRFLEWIEEQRVRRAPWQKLEDLTAHMKEANSGTASAHKRRTEKPAAQKMGGGQKNTTTIPKDEQGRALMERLRYRVKSSLESPVQPKDTKDNWGIMVRLREQFGADTVQRYIDGITDPKTWAAAKARYKIDAHIPTPALLLGWAETLIPFVLGLTEAPALRRSGGAEVTAEVVNPLAEFESL